MPFAPRASTRPPLDPPCAGPGVCPAQILPNAPVRQWVLSLPFELSGLAATKPDVLTALGRIFAEEVARATKRLAGVDGTETDPSLFPNVLDRA